MAERNYSIDLLKSISVLSVMWLHIGTFIVPNDTLIWNYTRGLASLSVPIFFIIAGYYLERSNRAMAGTIKLLKLYLVVCAVTIVFDFILGNTHSASLFDRLVAFKDAGYSIGYLWFLKNLIIYRVGYSVCAKHDFAKKAAIILVFLLPFIQLVVPFGLFNETLFYMTLGVVVSMITRSAPLKVHPAVILSVPIIMAFKTLPVNYLDLPTFISTMILFVAAIANNIKSNRLDFFSEHSIGFLVSQYFVINIIKHYQLQALLPFIPWFVIVVLCSSLLIVGYRYVSEQTFG